jgi:sec-independent protein translocase protein TatC
MDETEAFFSFWSHIEALRRSFLKILCIITIATFVCFIFHEPIVSFLIKPISQELQHSTNEEQLEAFRIHNSSQKSKIILLPEKSLYLADLSRNVTVINNSYSIAPWGQLVYAKTASQGLILLSPLEGFLISLKISVWLGIFLSSPAWFFVIAQFLYPGLYKHERKLILPFIITSLVFVIIGCLFAYFLTIPIANQYFTEFNGEIGRNLWSLGNYLDYTLFLLIANGIAFECGAIGIFAIHLQLISAKGLKNKRPFAILGAFILAALLTPPDVLSQFMLAIPLIVLYEALIFYSRLMSHLNFGKGNL